MGRQDEIVDSTAECTEPNHLGSTGAVDFEPSPSPNSSSLSLRAVRMLPMARAEPQGGISGSPARRGRPVPHSPLISAQMSRMPRTSTGPEVEIRRALHRRGLRFRLHRRDLPGTPDIILSGVKVAVFIDGCFWHACPDHGSLPKSNRDWWEAKLTENRRRDQRKDAELEELGWLPVHCWEHEPTEEAAERVALICSSRRVEHHSSISLRPRRHPETATTELRSGETCE